MLLDLGYVKTVNTQGKANISFNNFDWTHQLNTTRSRKYCLFQRLPKFSESIEMQIKNAIKIWTIVDPKK
jgi:hypothetical protein